MLGPRGCKAVCGCRKIHEKEKVKKPRFEEPRRRHLLFDCVMSISRETRKKEKKKKKKKKKRKHERKRKRKKEKKDKKHSKKRPRHLVRAH